MTLTHREREELKNNPEKYGLSDEDLERVLSKPRLYNPFTNPRGEECPVCSNTACIKAISYVDEGDEVHEDDHPEYRAARGRERRR